MREINTISLSTNSPDFMVARALSAKLIQDWAVSALWPRATENRGENPSVRLVAAIPEPLIEHALQLFFIR